MHTAGMLSEFESVKNLHEAAVFEMVQALASSYPSFGGDAELLADVACVALNRVPPRYIRHMVDLRFYQDNNERVRAETAVKARSGVCIPIRGVAPRFKAGLTRVAIHRWFPPRICQSQISGVNV